MSSTYCDMRQLVKFHCKSEISPAFSLQKEKQVYNEIKNGNEILERKA